MSEKRGNIEYGKGRHRSKRGMSDCKMSLERMGSRIGKTQKERGVDGKGEG